MEVVMESQKKQPGQEHAGPTMADKDRTGNVRSASLNKAGNAPAVDANEEEGSSANRPGNGSKLRDSRTDESGARLD
jgi:hypothetical protein